MFTKLLHINRLMSLHVFHILKVSCYNTVVGNAKWTTERTIQILGELPRNEGS